MATWKRIRGNGEITKWDQPGKLLVGRWRGSESGSFGQLGKIDTQEGPVRFPITAALSCLENVANGQMVRLEYVGEEVSRTGRTFKAFNVDVADGEAKPQAETTEYGAPF